MAENQMWEAKYWQPGSGRVTLWVNQDGEGMDAIRFVGVVVSRWRTGGVHAAPHLVSAPCQWSADERFTV